MDSEPELQLLAEEKWSKEEGHKVESDWQFRYLHSQEILRFAQNDMLAKSQRLNLKKDFKWVAAGKKVESKYLKLFIRIGENNPPAGGPRVGIALSSKTFKKATERSRAKRLVSQAFQSTFHLLPSTINIVALPKAGVIDVKSGDVLQDLEAALKKELVILSD